MSIQFNYVLPGWLTALLIGAFLGALIYGTLTLVRKQIAGKLIALLTAVRLAIFVVFTLILLQPAVSYTRNVAQLPEMLVLVDATPSMALAGKNGTRLEEAVATLTKGDLAEALRERYRLQWYALERTATPLDAADLQALKPTPAALQLANAIADAARHARALGKNPQRVLLVSAGNDRGEGDPVETARRLGLNVDVLMPGDGTSADAPGIEIADVQSARRVLLGSETIFRVTINGKLPTGKDRAFVLTVTEDGKKILEHPAVLKAGRSDQTLLLTHRPNASGLRQYDFQLTGADARAKPYPLAVQVLDSKYEVLVLEDRWRWEYKYLHRLFEDDPSFRFSALLNRGGGAFVQFGSPDRRVNLVGFPQNRSDLEGFDTFVLGDVDPAKWPRGLANDLARLIADEGKSLIVIAGPNVANLAEIPELHAVLPVELTRESGKPIEGPIEVRLRADAHDSPFFFQLGNAEKLPPLDQIYPVLRKRAGATVLLEAAKERNPYGNLIVIAEHTVGRGRVLFVATDTLWKWQTLSDVKEGPTPYSIFWQQAFRAMTPARSNIGAVNLWLTPNRSRAEVGRSVVIRAEVQSNRPLASASVQGTVQTPDDKRMPLVFTVDPSNPRMFHVELSYTQPGLHRVVGTVVAEGKVLAEAMTSIQVDEPRGVDAGVDRTGLARLAQDTGGQVIDPARPESWPTPGDNTLPPIVQARTIDLWSNFTLMLLLCGLLGVDWFVRLFKGLLSG